ncbi:YutD family protein [Paenibacillus sp. WLX2291]|uniref:YutD family protein n=1 Tax=Paenibacillus sp. WLX2291 TaxID=3296934 RepID=UPI003983F31A
MIQIGGKTYEIIKEYRNGWNVDIFRERYSEVLERYDYILGDWGYNQLRLKGFYRDGHPKAAKDSSLSSLTEYINEYCNFGCAYFVLQKTKDGPPEAKSSEGGDKPQRSSRSHGKRDRGDRQDKGSSGQKQGKQQASAQATATGFADNQAKESSPRQKQQNNQNQNQQYHQNNQQRQNQQQSPNQQQQASNQQPQQQTQQPSPSQRNNPAPAPAAPAPAAAPQAANEPQKD